MADLDAAEDAVEDEAASDAAQEQEQAPVVRLVRAILMGAINANTSDIHLEPHVPSDIAWTASCSR
jgi:type IV pilus assembly protein PilB